MHNLLTATTLTACFVAASALLGAPRDGSGSVSGRVLLTRVRGVPLASSAYQSRAVGSHTPTPTPEVQNVLVYLREAKVQGPLPVLRREMRQEGETFVPSVLAITTGSSISFPNADPFFHNVFSLSKAAQFNLGRYAKGDTRVRTFDRAGLVKVYCDIHSHMSASLLVLDHPYFTSPEPDGTFAIPNIPPGRYTLVGWHERVGERMSTVEIRAGLVSSVDLALPIEDPS